MRIKILGESIDLSEDYQPVTDLKFLKDNPRVYAVTHAEGGFEQLTAEEQQDLIFQKLKNEPSVRNLRPEVERHGGLLEPVLVRLDTMEVIEGNSRLAVYRILHEKRRGGDWALIPCYLVTSLTPRQQAAFLNQIHVKGKTQWRPYEKANFAYVRRIGGMAVDDIATLFGESRATIRTRINAIGLMKNSNDTDQSHFSHYDVLVRVPEIWRQVKESNAFRERLLDGIRTMDARDGGDFTAPDLRKKLPIIIKKPKVLQRFVAGTIDLDEGYHRAKVSRAEERVKDALALLEEISGRDVAKLDPNSLNSLRQAVRKLARDVERIRGIVAKGGRK